MTCQSVSYEAICDRIQPGDIIAFSGHGLPSEVVKLATQSVISHVGVVLTVGVTPGGSDHQMIESMPIEGSFGVTIRNLKNRVSQHSGPLWWLPLAQGVRRRLEVSRLQDFLRQQDGKIYDFVQAISAGFDALEHEFLLGRVAHNQEDDRAWFCSELVVAGLKAGGILQGVNSAEVTPKDLCTFNLYQPLYYQLKGEHPIVIEDYNTLKL